MNRTAIRVEDIVTLNVIISTEGRTIVIRESVTTTIAIVAVAEARIEVQEAQGVQEVEVLEVQEVQEAPEVRTEVRTEVRIEVLTEVLEVVLPLHLAIIVPEILEAPKDPKAHMTHAATIGQNLLLHPHHITLLQFKTTLKMVLHLDVMIQKKKFPLLNPLNDGLVGDKAW